MEIKEIENGNKLIAEFMGTFQPYSGKYSGEHSIVDLGGISYTQNNGCDFVTDGSVIRVNYLPENMLYHTDWNWLMPVVRKIFLVSTEDEEMDFKLKFWDKWIFLEGDIEQLFKLIIDTIDWYNKNKS